MTTCKECGGKIVRKGVWTDKVKGMGMHYYPYARVCEKCGRIVSL